MQILVCVNLPTHIVIASANMYIEKQDLESKRHSHKKKQPLLKSTRAH